MRAFVAMRQMATEIKENPLAKLEKRVEDLSQYIEDILEDVNEDTRMQLELINEATAELQIQNKAPKQRKRIGFNPAD